MQIIIADAFGFPDIGEGDMFWDGSLVLYSWHLNPAVISF
jgi:hypothetical protein